MIDPRFYTLSPPQSLQEIADRCGAELVVKGAGDDMIEAPASLAESKAGEVTFFSNKRLKHLLETAAATACLTTEKLSPFVTKTGMISLITSDPRASFARLTQSMATEGAVKLGDQKIHPEANIHPAAVIGAGVSIGKGSKISPYAVIDDGVVIGENCVVEPHTHISFSVIGDRCHIKAGSVIGGTGFGIAKDESGIFNIPHLGRVVIGDDVLIGSNGCVDRGQLGDTVISNHVKIDNQVQIAHNVFIDEGAMLAGHAGVSGSCHIGKNVMFGGRAGSADHIKIGDGAILAASAGLMSDIPPGEMWSGVPAMPIREHMRTVATLKKLAKK